MREPRVLWCGIAAAVVTVIASAAARGAEPVGWRNNGTGQFPATDPPQAWSRDENVKWRTEMPGRSLASPIIVRDKVFVTADPADLVCVSLSDGARLWQRPHQYVDVFGPEKGEKIETDLRAAKELRKEIELLEREKRESEKAGDKDSAKSFEPKISALQKQAEALSAYPPVPSGEPGNTCATPVSDGAHVFAVFGTGVISSHTLDGKREWLTFAESPGGDHSASPVLIEGKLIVHLRNLVALDAATGAVLWRTATSARHGSPVVARIGGTAVIITPKGAVVRASDGALLAKDQFQLAHCSPLVHENSVYAVEDGRVQALELPDTLAGPLELKQRWEATSARTNRLASPLYHEGLLYSVTEQGVLEVLDAATGERAYRERLDFKGGRADPSFCLAGSTIFVSSSRGTTILLEPGRTFKPLARNELEDFSSSAAFHGGQMLVRTKKYLYCLGK